MSLRKPIVQEPRPPPNQATQRALLTFDELPSWQQDNKYILTSYRPASGSFYLSLRSIFNQVHNETVNIHTHLAPSLIFAACPLFHPGSTLLPFLPFYFGAASCLLISSLFHATSNVSPSVDRMGNQIDYVGILLLITGSFVPSIYFGFLCHTGLQRLYWGMICSLGLACGVVTVSPRFRTPAWRTWRALMYVALGLSAFVPVIHGLRLYGWYAMEDRIAIRWVLGQGGLYIAGAALYAVSCRTLTMLAVVTLMIRQARIPEKWCPGRFDVLGSSHQIFHLFVVVAALVHWAGLIKAAEHAQNRTTCEDVM